MWTSGEWADIDGTRTDYVAGYIIEWEADSLLSTVNRTTLEGDEGTDTLYGAAGLDIFLFETSTALTSVDTIENFDAAGRDVIDISDLLGYNPLTDNINDFVTLTESGGNTTLAVDTDGLTGGANFVDIAQINGVTGLDLHQMIAADNLIV